MFLTKVAGEYFELVVFGFTVCSQAQLIVESLTTISALQWSRVMGFSRVFLKLGENTELFLTNITDIFWSGISLCFSYMIIYEMFVKPDSRKCSFRARRMRTREGTFRLIMKSEMVEEDVMTPDCDSANVTILQN